MMREGELEADINEFSSNGHFHSGRHFAPPHSHIKPVRQKFPETWIWANMTIG